MDIGVIGLGLIGGSIAYNFAPDLSIVGYDIDRDACEEAKKRGAIEHIAESLEGFSESKLIFIATPPQTIVQVLHELAPLIRKDAVVTDTAGTKLSIMESVLDELPTLAPWFVGGHPMAGKERGRIAEARRGLFEGAPWIVTPVSCTDRPALEMVMGTVSTFGARPVPMSPLEHDETVALLSHVPHILAGALVELAEPLTHRNVGAGSWEDLTRVAGADPALWAQIVIENRKPIAAMLARLSNRLDYLRVTVESGDHQRLENFFEGARSAKLGHKRK